MALRSERVFCLLTAHDDYAFWLVSIILHSLNSQEHHQHLRTVHFEHFA